MIHTGSQQRIKRTGLTFTRHLSSQHQKYRFGEAGVLNQVAEAVASHHDFFFGLGTDNLRDGRHVMMHVCHR
jgi:hypothetical protein